MATWPAKTNYATGDVLTAAQMQDIGNALNSVGSAQYAAGKNKIINGDFGIWQRGTTQSVIDNSPVYGSADRWLFSRNGTTSTGTNTVSRQTFTPGQTDVPNNPTYFCRWTVTTLATSQTRIDVNHYVEDVATFAGQTVTVSFYGKASTARSYELYLEQNFGSGGSSAVATLIGSGTITTGWTRLSVTGTLPSISGKTVGASNYLRLILRVTSVQTSDVFEFANAQLEAGSIATPFQTATGTLAGELAACQRYYQVIAGYQAGGNAYSTTAAVFMRHFPVVMRTAPTPTYPGTLTSAIQNFSIGNATPTAVTTGNATTQAITFYATGATGLTAYNPTFWSGLDIALSSEL